MALYPSFNIVLFSFSDAPDLSAHQYRQNEGIIKWLIKTVGTTLRHHLVAGSQRKKFTFI